MNLKIALLAIVVIVAGILMVSRVPTDSGPGQTVASVTAPSTIKTNSVHSTSAVSKSVRPVTLTSPPVGSIQIKSSKPNSLPSIEDLGAALQALTPEEREAYEKQVAEKVGSLIDLMTESDTKSIQQVVTEVLNPDVRIRDAAVNVIKQIHSPESIPKLEGMMEKTDDPRMKVQLMDAIEYIKLPTLTEVREQKRLRALERGEPLKPKKTAPEPTLTAPVN